MRVSKNKLVQYSIPDNLFFATRSGSENTVTCRDAYFNAHPSALKDALYCAIGSDELGWELERYNGINWALELPDTSYSLIITNAGLAALTNIKRGGLQLYFSGIKIIGNTVLSPATPIVGWKDQDFLAAGGGVPVFSVGTNGARVTDEHGQELLKKILRWRFNSSSGGLQYILTLPADGFGSTADDGSTVWPIGAIGLYIKDPTDNTTDVLFAVASLPEVVTKRATDIDVVGSAIKLYFNTILTNLGIVSDLQVMAEADVDLPFVPNESLLTYPTNADLRPHNTYLVGNLYGTNMPAIAVQRGVNNNLSDDDNLDNDIDWAWFQPSDNFISVSADDFDNAVQNYDLVYWDPDAYNTKKQANGMYKQAQGATNIDGNPNTKMPIGIRVGNSIVFSGTITNNSYAYQYTVSLANGGAGYERDDELLIPVDGNITFKLVVTGVGANNNIETFRLVGPTVGSTEIPGDTHTVQLPAIYDPRGPLPRTGSTAQFIIQSERMSNSEWNFENWLNKPVYCSAVNPGKITNEQTDSMVGWVVAANSVKLGLDLQNEATSSQHGTVRFATNDEVRRVAANAGASLQTAVCPKWLKSNYLQISKPNQTGEYTTGDGSSLANATAVDTFVRFNQIVIGKGAQTPYENTTLNPYIDNGDISFYGIAYRAWYKDIAEYYESDDIYEPGTLVTFGKGIKEISIADRECNGIISSNPGYELGLKKSEYDLPVALAGRVPVLFDGHCMPRFGDKIYLSKVKPGCASTIENGKCIGKVIARKFGTSRLIECVVRIDF